MLVGEVMNKGGLTERLIAAANVLVGRSKGGLAYVNLLTNAMAASILGSAIAQIAVMIVLVPILLPASIALGIDSIHFGVVTALATLIGLVTPPVGPGLFVVMSQNQMKMGELFKAMIPFLAMMLAMMVVINALPALSLWLPKALGM